MNDCILLMNAISVYITLYLYLEDYHKQVKPSKICIQYWDHITVRFTEPPDRKEHSVFVVVWSPVSESPSRYSINQKSSRLWWAHCGSKAHIRDFFDSEDINYNHIWEQTAFWWHYPQMEQKIHTLTHLGHTWSTKLNNESKWTHYSVLCSPFKNFQSN